LRSVPTNLIPRKSTTARRLERRAWKKIKLFQSSAPNL